MARVVIDGKSYEVDGRRNLLHACLSLKLDLPYFCWHPAMGSVGACRQCAVKQFKDDRDTAGRLVMACMTPAADGTRISIDDPEAKAFRASVIEWLMLNHPHDCPVCDEGGECHLQDMTVMTGHVVRRNRFPKRTYHNQDLGPFLTHEMNRCIQCYRCVRFYRDYAGGRDFDVFGAHDQVYFGRAEDGVLESEFSGNLVEVCPTGVFTDKTLARHYTRKWDLQWAPSICAHCGLGCNTSVAERGGMLRRVMNRVNPEVNGHFLCDRGRFGYERAQRVTEDPEKEKRTPEDSEKKGLSESSGSSGVKRFSEFSGSLCGLLIGIGSPRASMESNFALQTLVGKDHFYSGLSDLDASLVSLILDILRNGPARAASLQDVENADAVFILGEDVTNTAPRLALSLRQSVRQKALERIGKGGIPLWHDAAVREAMQDEHGPLFIATPYATRLDDVATAVWRAAPDDLARLGLAVAHEIDAEAPAVSGFRMPMNSMADALRDARRPIVVCGTSCGSVPLIQAAANVAWALRRQGRAADLCFTVPECNTMGAALLGGGRLGAAFEAEADTVIILENDLYGRAGAAQVDGFLGRVKHVVVLDHLRTRTTSKAHLVLPAATFAESSGTTVNNEGRAQRFFQVLPSREPVMASWRWISEMLVAAGRTGWASLDEVLAAMGDARIRAAAPPAAGQRIPRRPPRYSGRTAMAAHVSVHEAPPPPDPDSPLAFSMEGFSPEAPPPLTPFFWWPGWNSIQAAHKFADGPSGVRLIEPGQRGAFFREVPAPFTPRRGEWWVVPVHHIFGTEEQSAMAPAIVKRSVEPTLALRPEDASDLGVSTGGAVQCMLDERTYRFRVQLRPELPVGVAGLSLMGATKGVGLPCWMALRRA
ncbi:MAG: NADH-quinone oxidoreductase subunit NuoG [Planctomycetes bacterium]|nr:NADH-quinone oxidoreductase subunit NuoG [Planctomycetota bacterium]